MARNWNWANVKETQWKRCNESSKLSYLFCKFVILRQAYASHTPFHSSKDVSTYVLLTSFIRYTLPLYYIKMLNQAWHVMEVVYDIQAIKYIQKNYEFIFSFLIFLRQRLFNQQSINWLKIHYLNTDILTSLWTSLQLLQWRFCIAVFSSTLFVNFYKCYSNSLYVNYCSKALDHLFNFK